MGSLLLISASDLQGLDMFDRDFTCFPVCDESAAHLDHHNILLLEVRNP